MSAIETHFHIYFKAIDSSKIRVISQGISSWHDMAHAIICILDPMDVMGWGWSVPWDKFVKCLCGRYENGDHGLWEFAHFAVVLY